MIKNKDKYWIFNQRSLNIRKYIYSKIILIDSFHLLSDSIECEIIGYHAISFSDKIVFNVRCVIILNRKKITKTNSINKVNKLALHKSCLSIFLPHRINWYRIVIQNADKILARDVRMTFVIF